VPTGFARLDAALPHGGLPGGAVTEVLSALDGGGAMTVALRAAIAAAAGVHTVVVLDPRGDLYPPAVWQMGLAEDLLLMVRPSGWAEALWALDQSLRCSGVAAVVASIDRIDAAASRRLQLAAESSGVLGILLRPAADRRHTFAAVQMLVEPITPPAPRSPSAGFSAVRCCRVRLMKVREGGPVEPFVIGLDDETGVEPLLPASVHGSAAGDRRRISA